MYEYIVYVARCVGCFVCMAITHRTPKYPRLREVYVSRAR